MPRLTRIYTRTGDDGTTGLGDGSRVPKDHLRIEAYGLVDQLNSHVGVSLASGPVNELAEPLRKIQNDLFNCGSDLCFPEAAKAEWKIPGIEQRHLDWLEQLMDRMTDQLPALENFILPGGTRAAAELHVARAVCRNAERAAVHLREHEPIGPFVVKYLNRLSDTLFIMARFENKLAGVAEPLWDSRA